MYSTRSNLLLGFHGCEESEMSQPAFDSVRAAFIEGDKIYPGAGFNEKTHIQICIINPNCIKGFFKPRIEHLIP
jgi:hypothetical protein